MALMMSPMLGHLMDLKSIQFMINYLHYISVPNPNLMGENVAGSVCKLLPKLNIILTILCNIHISTGNMVIITLHTCPIHFNRKFPKMNYKCFYYCKYKIHFLCYVDIFTAKV